MAKKYKVSDKRIPSASPERLVLDGKAQFGTFDKVIPDINLIDSEKPCGNLMPDFMKASRLTVWEAFEVQMDEGLLVSAVYNMGGSVGFSIFVWFDKQTGKVTSWLNPVLAVKAHVASNLVNTKTSLKTRSSSFVLDNQFQNHRCIAKGHSKSKKKGTIDVDMTIDGISPPSIVNIPFAENKSLYSQKEFFTVKGKIKINDKVYTANERTTAIIDDHKGFYPLHAHYDWLTSMGRIKHKGKDIYLGFNLTRNQSINQDDYNENLLWVDDKAFPLPPVKFKHKDKNTWIVKDKYGYVDITFHIIDLHPMKVPVLLNYILPFGKLEGYIKDTNGVKYSFDGMDGIGEDKTTNI